jgi:multiple antibiotic resistance protein
VDASAVNSIAHKLMVSAIVALVAIIVYVALRVSAKAGTYLSATAMTIFNRVMGLIIASIAVEFMIGGLAAHFPILMQARS